MKKESKDWRNLPAPEGLLGWVADYIEMRFNKNVNAAAKIKANIDKEIKKLKLDPKKVYFYFGDPGNPSERPKVERNIKKFFPMRGYFKESVTMKKLSILKDNHELYLNEEESIELDEKAKSEAQQQAAGAALAAKRGEIPVSDLTGASKRMYDDMTEDQLEDFAGTKHKGIPEKIDDVFDRYRARYTRCIKLVEGK